MYTVDALPLISCIEPIVDDSVVPRGSSDVKEFLGIEPKTVTLDQVRNKNQKQNHRCPAPFLLTTPHVTIHDIISFRNQTGRVMQRVM